MLQILPFLWSLDWPKAYSNIVHHIYIYEQTHSEVKIPTPLSSVLRVYVFIYTLYVMCFSDIS